MPLVIPLDTSSMAALAQALAAMTPEDFKGTIDGLMRRFKGVNWPVVLAALGTATPQLTDVSVANGAVSAKGKTAAAGALGGLGTLLPAIAGKRYYVRGLYTLATGAAAQTPIAVEITSGATLLTDFLVAAPANGLAVLPIPLIIGGINENLTIASNPPGAAAANTEQSIYLAGYSA